MMGAQRKLALEITASRTSETIKCKFCSTSYGLWDQMEDHGDPSWLGEEKQLMSTFERTIEVLHMLSGKHAKQFL